MENNHPNLYPDTEMVRGGKRVHPQHSTHPMSIMMRPYIMINVKVKINTSWLCNKWPVRVMKLNEHYEIWHHYYFWLIASEFIFWTSPENKTHALKVWGKEKKVDLPFSTNPKILTIQGRSNFNCLISYLSTNMNVLLFKLRQKGVNLSLMDKSCTEQPLSL